MNPRPWMVLLLLAKGAAAEVTLAPLFQDGAVFQRDQPVPVWGRAEPGGGLEISFAGQTATASAGADGRWMAELPAMPASAEGRSLVVRSDGGGRVEVRDVVVGEVWLASGQSNMQWSIAQSRQEDQQAAAESPVPLLRFFQVPRVLNHARQESVNAKWQPSTPETTRQFSAVAYFFGRELAGELGVPIGIIHSSWGGSRIEPWWAEEGLEGIAALEEKRRERLAKSPGFPGYDQRFRRFVDDIGKWSAAAAGALDDGRPAPEMPAVPERLALGHNAQTGTYQAMIHPLVPYALRGFLWYQGESNNGEGLLYTTKKEALIAGWRKQFRAPEGPFLFVQLAPYNYGDQRTYDLPGIWKAQQETLKIPHTGMAVTNDIGDVKDIHPGNKSEVGRRLALWALADSYGREGLVKSGPLFAGYEVAGARVVVRFDHVGGGLVTRDEQAPSHFEIAGADGAFHPAQAAISEDGKTVVLEAAAVPAPEQARFAWNQLAEPNLMNREGLPAGAFHSH